MQQLRGPGPITRAPRPFLLLKDDENPPFGGCAGPLLPCTVLALCARVGLTPITPLLLKAQPGSSFGRYRSPGWIKVLDFRGRHVGGSSGKSRLILRLAKFVSCRRVGVYKYVL
jgi:hypothetical protein